MFFAKFTILFNILVVLKHVILIQHTMLDNARMSICNHNVLLFDFLGLTISNSQLSASTIETLQTYAKMLKDIKK